MALPVWVVLVAGFVSIVVAWVLNFYRKCYRYWPDRNVPHTKPSFPMGDLAGANTSKNLSEVIKKVYLDHPGKPYVGMWNMFKPALMIRDPELIKKIIIQDFASFHDHGNYFNEEGDPLSAHLFSLKGAAWRNLRAKLTPTFTSGKMKAMFPIIASCSEQLVKLLEEPARRRDVIETRDVLQRFTMEVVSLVAFGIESNSLKDPNSEFVRMGKKTFASTFSVIWRNTLAFLVPDLAAKLKIRIVPSDVNEFFLKLFSDNFNYRVKNQVKRNDFMQLLIQLTTKGYLEDVDAVKKESPEDAHIKNMPFTMIQAAAQAFVFFIGGSETTSTTITYALYELAKQPDLQEKVRKDIQTVLAKHNGQLTYEALAEMRYLDNALSETLRMHSPAPVLDRVCTKDYYLDEYGLKIDAGTTLTVCVNGLHEDPQYFPNPTKFDPDRFTDEVKATRPNYTYIPFGDGPRICIGQRFALLKIKTGLATLINNFRFEMAPKTPVPLVLDPKSLTMQPKGGLPLIISKAT